MASAAERAKEAASVAVEKLPQVSSQYAVQFKTLIVESGALWLTIEHIDKPRHPWKCKWQAAYYVGWATAPCSPCPIRQGSHFSRHCPKRDKTDGLPSYSPCFACRHLREMSEAV
jgi:hypothetical protein